MGLNKKGPSIIRIGFWDVLYYRYNRDPPPHNRIGNLGLYTRCILTMAPTLQILPITLVSMCFLDRSVCSPSAATVDDDRIELPDIQVTFRVFPFILEVSRGHELLSFGASGEGGV